jgi:hypothetical protein
VWAESGAGARGGRRRGPARHGRGGFGLLRQRWAAHTSWHGESRMRTGEGSMDVTDRRGRGASGVWCQWRGAGGREKRGAARRRGTDIWAWPAQCRAARLKLGLKLVQNYSNGSNEIQIPPNFGWFKRYLPLLQKFEIKYGWKAFEMRNNFAYRNFHIFWMDFEIKSWKFLYFEIQWNFLGKSWDFWFWWN